MMSSTFELDHPKEEASSRFVADVGRLLQTALVDRKAISKLTQQEIADRLGVDRSSVNRNFSGYRNLTLSSLAELCWAMDVEPSLVIEQILEPGKCNFQSPKPAPVHTMSSNSAPPMRASAADANTLSFTVRESALGA